MDVPTYSLAERDRRWALARELMAAEEVEALVCYGEHEYVEAAPFAAGIAEVLREHHLEHAAVGVLGLDIVALWHLNPITPYMLSRKVLDELPGVTFKPVGRRFMLATICLSQEEQAAVRYSAAAGDHMAQAMLEAAAPGASEADVCAAGMAAGFRLGCQPPSMLIWSGPGFVAWGPPAWGYRPRPPRTLAEGDLLLAEVFNRFGMKETQHQMAIAIGDVHPDIEAAAAIARASHDEGLKAARAGNTFGDLVQAMTAPLTDARSWNIHPLVQALNPFGPVGGFGGPGGLDQLPEARRCSRLFEPPTVGAELPLAPGMSWAFEPSAVVGSRAVNLGGTVIIGEDGPIELNPLTAQLLRA